MSLVGSVSGIKTKTKKNEFNTWEMLQIAKRMKTWPNDQMFVFGRWQLSYCVTVTRLAVSWLVVLG